VVLEKDGATYSGRHIERLRKVPYPEIVRIVKECVRSPQLRGHCALIVDQTGVGRPVVDMLRLARLAPIPVSITGGDAVSGNAREGFRVPKRDLAGVLQVLVQASRLHFAQALPDLAVLQKELLNFKVKIDPQTAHDSYSAWREGDHDDLVLAVALACWYGECGRGPWGVLAQGVA
jgi:hypothetical protein